MFTIKKNYSVVIYKCRPTVDRVTALDLFYFWKFLSFGLKALFQDCLSNSPMSDIHNSFPSGN